MFWIVLKYTLFLHYATNNYWYTENRECQTGKQCFIPNTLSILLTGDNPSQKERPQSSVGFGNFTTLKGKLQF